MRVIIEDLSHDARGVARVDGKIVFIDGALPGEEIEFEYTKKRKDFDEGRVLEIIQASADRVTPACPHFGVCGGCSLQHLHPQAQLLQKQAHWLQLMRKMGGGPPVHVLEPLQEDVWHYRRKARLGVKYVPKKEKVLLGFREKNHPQYLIDMQECPILPQEFMQHFSLLQALFNRWSNPKSIPQIELAQANDMAMVIRHLEALTASDEEALIEFAEKTGFKIYLQAKGPDSLQLFYPKNAPFELEFSLGDLDASLRFYPLDFFQVNAKMNIAMIKQAMDLLEINEDDVVLDLFCGLGNFSLPMARKAKHVYGFEGQADMIKRAKEHAQNLSIHNVNFSVADLQDLSSMDLLKDLSCTKVLLDPARDGAETVVHALGQMQVKRIVYVSCHPATLARDAAILRGQYAYRMQAAGVMDMFPHTSHIESMALFIKE